MLEIRGVEQLTIIMNIKTDLEGPVVNPHGSGDPAEAIESRYASKSSIRYKNWSKSWNSCPVPETWSRRLHTAHAFHCSHLLVGIILDKSKRIETSRPRFARKNLENPREQWSSPHFLHGENQAQVIRTHPITLIFTQYITKALVELRFTGIYEILSELGGVGCTNRSNFGRSFVE